jgi:hypothetical protein
VYSFGVEEGKIIISWESKRSLYCPDALEDSKQIVAFQIAPFLFLNQNMVKI